MPRPPLIHYSRGIHNISNGVPVSSSTNPSTVGNPSQPRLSYAERLKANGTAATENQLSYAIPNSTAAEVSVKLTHADRGAYKSTGGLTFAWEFEHTMYDLSSVCASFLLLVLCLD